MRKGRFGVLAALLMGLGSAACAGNAGGNEGPSPASNETMIEVTNNNWSDMVVYLRANGGMRQRLGMVTSMRRERLRISPAMLPTAATVQLEGDPVGSYRTFLSDPITLERGGTLVWRIEATPSLSFLSAR